MYVEKQERYNLTNPQKRIWYIEKIYPNSPINNIGGLVKINGKIDYKRLEKAINLSIKKYSGLRLRIVEENERTYQYVSKYQEKKIDFFDFSTFKESLKELEKWSLKEFRTPFFNENSEMYYFALYKINERCGGIFVRFHHIVSDGWSITLLHKSICEFYNLLNNNTEIDSSIELSYIDFLEEENLYLNSEKFLKNKNVWNCKLTNLPEASLSNCLSNFDGNRLSYRINPELSNQIRNMINERKYSIYSFFISIITIYLSKVSQENDLILGNSIYNRSGKKSKDTVGMFTSTMPLRLEIDPNNCIDELIHNVNRELKACYINQSYPYNLLLEDLNIKKSGFDNLFTVSINYYNTQYINSVEDLIFEIDEFYNGNQVFPLEIVIKEDLDKEGIILQFSYKSSIYSKEDIEAAYKRINHIIEQVISNFNCKISEIDILTKEERKKILYDFNNTKVEYPNNLTIQQMFEDQVERNPNNTAVIFENEQLTYKELNRKSNQIARILRRNGVGPNTIVGIMVERSFEMIVGIMAIIKAGGAYLPINPEYPEERIKYIIIDSKMKILLVTDKYENKQIYSCPLYNLQEERMYQNEDISNVQLINSSSDLAYVIYTSGSTGDPKGAMIEHHSVVNRINWMQKKYTIDENDIILQKTNYTFDVSVWELFWWAMYGAKLCLLLPGGERDPEAIVDCINKNKISTIHFVPSMLNLFLEHLEKNSNCLEKIKSLKRTFASGEALNSQQIRRFSKLINQKNKTQLINLYGPTEATVDVTYFDCINNKYEKIVPIGKPIDNTKIYIVNNLNELQPIGIQGELCISGEGLARGYLNKEELTIQRFISNPFESGEKMYKTGDKARWLSDGNIEYLGRNDYQVKIRGFRIELGEIEYQLLKIDYIKDAVILPREDEAGNKSLCGYIISDKKIIVSELREYLLQRLPEYMIPGYFVQLERIPLTSNGKVDRKLLPSPNNKYLSADYEAPRNEIENTISNIWAEVLGVDRVGINDNFFVLGGDSIKSIQISSRLRKYNIGIEIRNILENPQIRELSRYAKELNSDMDQDIVEGTVNLTPIQLDFMKKNLYHRNHYNQAVMLYRQEGFDEAIIRNVFERIVEHHDALRMIYRYENDNITQYNRNAQDGLIEVKVFDLIGDEDYSEKIQEEANRLQTDIDLEKGLLIKLGIFKTRHGNHLLIIIHHLVVDGVSWRIILEDFAAGYSQAIRNERIKLQLKTSSYKEWSEGIQSYANSKALLKEIKYWINLEERENEKTKADSIINQRKYIDFKIMTITLREEETSYLLKNVNKAFNTEINDILLTALGLAIKETKGSNQILIDLEGHGRENIIEGIDLSRTIGWFTSIYPVILDMSLSKNLSSAIIYTKETLRKIPNKGIGYSILKYLTKEENKKALKFNLNSSICFNYLGQFDQDIDLREFNISKLSVGQTVSNEITSVYDIVINSMITGGKLNISTSYNCKEFDDNTIKEMLSCYKNKLLEIIKFCMNKGEIELTPSDLSFKEISIEEFNELKDDIFECIEID